jgi:hypothetical protein
MKNSFIKGGIPQEDNIIPLISTTLDIQDYMGAVMVRWGINRDSYRVNPGLYAVGSPGCDSDVFVTSNYKLTFDLLRKNLAGLNGWILVLDTKGVNVWCAAGKGTFGTQELVNRIRLVSLDKVVNHRRLILPQLGATGVAAHKVKEQSGFNVHYGPVLASDIRKFVSAGYRADKPMRKVTFGFKDRIKLIPNDFMYGKFYLLGAMALLLIISGVSGKGYSLGGLSTEAGPVIIKILLAYVAGIVLTPMLLPYIPGKYFSLKGFIAGGTIFLVLLWVRFAGTNAVSIISWFLVMTAISSFLAMNFTGSSTYTSLSGVKKEMKISLPFQIGFASVGIILQIVGKLI